MSAKRPPTGYVVALRQLERAVTELFTAVQDRERPAKHKAAMLRAAEHLGSADGLIERVEDYLSKAATGSRKAVRR